MKVCLTAILAWTWSQPFFMDSFPSPPSSWRPRDILLLLEAQFLSPKHLPSVAELPEASQPLCISVLAPTPGQGPGLERNSGPPALSEHLVDKAPLLPAGTSSAPLSPSLLSPSHGAFRPSFPSPSTPPVPGVPAPAARAGALPS